MDVMLDLETMGNNSNAAIIAIGAVAFESGIIKDEFYIEINLHSSMQYGGYVDGSTVMWWLKQSAEARGAFADNDKAEKLPQALDAFSAWLKKINVREVWGNGAMFDNTILGNAYSRLGLPAPWKFWNDRCYRALKSMNTSIALDRVGTHHNAVDDARSQALHLFRILGGEK